MLSNEYDQLKLPSPTLLAYVKKKITVVLTSFTVPMKSFRKYHYAFRVYC